MHLKHIFFNYKFEGNFERHIKFKMTFGNVGTCFDKRVSDMNGIGVGRAETRELECPFCKKGKVKVVFKESYIQANASSISAGKKYTYQKIPEKWVIKENCPACGAKKKDIQDVYDGKRRPETKEERIRRIKEPGLPTTIEM